jgi:hypothetical protein
MAWALWRFEWPGPSRKPDALAAAVALEQNRAAASDGAGGGPAGARRAHRRRPRFHLFRLPEELERSLFELLLDTPAAEKLHASLIAEPNAMSALRYQFDASPTAPEGPMLIGGASDLQNGAWLTTAAGCYHAAFAAGLRCYPYLADDRS